MHDSLLVHYDIKPDNLLRNKDIFFFADFGVSEKIEISDATITKGDTWTVLDSSKVFLF